MKNKNIIILVFLIAAMGIGIYIIKGQKFENLLPETTKLKLEEPELKTIEEGVKTEGLEIKTRDINKEYVLEKNEFSLMVPAGWEEVEAPREILAKIANLSENTAIFRSYIAVTREPLDERTEEEYLKEVKDSLTQIFPDIIFTKEDKADINGQAAYFLEIEFTQNEINIKILLVLVQGKNENVWTLGFNTVEDSWLNYKDLFYRTAKTFKVK